MVNAEMRLNQKHTVAKGTTGLRLGRISVFRIRFVSWH